ncbi:hypothetical protein M3A88_10545 [Kocuria marina]|uniref:hypothetical protein n=1 Tax=Kocuria marina TaxID=223184 RepID=UPI002989FF26|nr:hypothetical protein [Kocuria marina]MCT1735668.1 hypothetical protein [Kocuria marina]
MSESEQHGSHDRSDRRRSGGDRGGRWGRDERGSSRGGGDRRFSRGDDDRRGTDRRGSDRSSYRGGSGGRPGDRDGFGGRGGSGRRSSGDDARSGYRGRDERAGSYGGRGDERRNDDRRGGYRRDDDRRGPRDGARGEERGGYGRRDDRREGGYGRRDERGDRDRREGGYGRRDDRREGGYGRRDDRGDRDRRDGGFAGRGGDRARQGGGRGFGARDERRDYRDDRRGDARGPERDDRRDAQPRFVAPDIDADVTGREIDRTVRRELQALEASNAERVSKHLVMAARYLDDDPEFALEHANAAVRKAGRIGAVREVAGIAAYAAGDYALALKELRTHRRISGSQAHLPLMVDAQRALGRVDKAMEEAISDAADALDAEGKAELAMVVSGIHADAGDEQAALAALEIPQLDKNRGFSYSPKLFRAYADALRAVGRDSEAMSWDRQAIVAEAALGMGQFSEPEIVDLGDDLDEDDARRTVREAQKRHSADRRSDDAPEVSTDSDEEAAPAREETAPSDDAAAPGDASADNHAPAESADGEHGTDTGHDRN